MDEFVAFLAWVSPTVVLATAIILLVLIYNEWNHQKLKLGGIPGPRGYPVVGSFLSTIKDGLLVTEERWSKEYGDVFGWRQGGYLIICVKDPDILKDILVRDFSNFTDRQPFDLFPHPVDKNLFNAEGKTWKRLRTIMSPTFSTGKLKHMSKQINVCAEQLAANFENAAEKGSEIKAKEFFGAFTMDVISSTSFGLDTNSQKNPEEPFTSHAKDIFKPDGPVLAFILAVIFPATQKISKAMGWGFLSIHIRDFFTREVEAMIEDRKQNDHGRTDFLNLMMKAEITEQDGAGEIRDLHKKMTVEEMVAQSFLFFLAGYETTASLLTYTSYLLAIHKDVQDQLVEEIERELGDEEPTYESVSKLHYMEQVFYEVLRLYPPVSRITRKTAETRTYKGITIPKGAIVSIPILNIQRDSRFYPDPENFNPSRFTTKSNQNQINFLAFGFGPRLCLGMRLALVKAKVALVHVLRKVEITSCPATKIPLKLMPNNGITQPEKPITIKAITRQQ